VWVITISYKDRKEFNNDLDNYLSRRRGEEPSFFKKVDEMFSKKNNSSIPELKPNRSTVYDDGSVREKKFLFFFKRKTRTAELMDEELQAHSEELTPVEKEELKSLEREVDSIEDEEMMLEVEKKSAIALFFGKLFGRRNKPKEDDFEDIDEDQIQAAVQEDTLKDETRVVLKALHKWISRLPPDQIEAFRRSQDFAMYKELLEKYGLVR